MCDIMLLLIIKDNFMKLSELKRLPITELINIAQEMGVENPSRMLKQDIIFAYLKARALKNEIDTRPSGVDQFFQPTPTEELVDRVLSLCQPIRMFTQDSNKDVDVQLEKMVQTFDTYIPEPLRNADGTPIYVHANGSSAVRATDGASSVGMFAKKSDKQQDLPSMDPLICGDSSLSIYNAGSKK